MADRSSTTRDRLKITFDTVAGRYQQARPEYPDELFGQLVAAAGLQPQARLLEVGCGPGKATIPLARRGFRITCLEPGHRLADAARRNLAGYPQVQVTEQALEDWQPLPPAAFDLVFAATSWHWIDPAVGYRRAFDALRPGGHLAIWAAGHVVPPDGDPFFRELQDVYDEIGEGMPAGTGYYAPGEQPDERAAIDGSGLFTVSTVRHFDWEISYTAPEYIGLLETFSSHIDMAGWQRDRLYAEIRRRLAGRPDGRVRRHWGAVLQVARRRDEPAAAAGPARLSGLRSAGPRIRCFTDCQQPRPVPAPRTPECPAGDAGHQKGASHEPILVSAACRKPPRAAGRRYSGRRGGSAGAARADRDHASCRQPAAHRRRRARPPYPR